MAADIWQWLTEHTEAALSSMAAAAIAGRLTWHTRLVQSGARKFFSPALLFEIPVVLFTWRLGIGVADWFGWSGPVAGAAVAVVSYLGPGGLQALLQRYVELKTGKN